MKKCTVLFLLFILIFSSSCQRWEKDLAMSEKSSDSPQYETEFDTNTSPASKE